MVLKKKKEVTTIVCVFLRKAPTKKKEVTTIVCVFLRKAPTKKKEVTTIVCVFLRKAPTKNANFFGIQSLRMMTEKAAVFQSYSYSCSRQSTTKCFEVLASIWWSVVSVWVTSTLILRNFFLPPPHTLFKMMFLQLIVSQLRFQWNSSVLNLFSGW